MSGIVNKIVIIELDGASWNVVEPLARQNRLPNLKRLMDTGVSGALASDPPLLSPRLWVSIFTGKGSRKHGVEFFGNSSAMVKCRRIWDIFSEKGLTVGVFGSFVTWPPYPVKGFMIPSLFALGPETYPEGYRFFQELTLMERKKGKADIGRNGKSRPLLYYAYKMVANGVSIKTLGKEAVKIFGDRLRGAPPDERYWKKAVAHLKLSGEFFIHLYKGYSPAFATFHIHLCDALAHRYWKFYEPERFDDIDPVSVERYRDVIPRAYEEADRVIGDIMRAAGDSVVMVVSDHGSGALESTRSACRLRVENFLNCFKLRKGVIPANVGLMTFCYFSDNRLMSRMKDVLEKVVFLDTGEKVFDVMQEESLLGVRLSQSLWGGAIDGDRTIELGEFGRCKFSELFSLQKMEVSGTHTKEGVLIMAGHGIKRGARVTGATIFDVAPTALTIAGLPAARDMDGRVLLDVFQEDFLEANPVRYVDTYEDSGDGEDGEKEDVSFEQIKGRLKSLGYL